MRGVRSDRGVLLRRTAYGESSLVVQVLTPRFGRVHLLAKGAYRPTSRYFAVLDLFDTLELQWSVRGGADLGLLREASISVRRRHLTDDLGAYGGALSALELAEIAARPGQPDPALFQLVEDALYGARGVQPPRDAPRVGRQALHAASLELAHPSDGSALHFEAPLPADLRGLLEWARG